MESLDLACSADTGADTAVPAGAWGPESSRPWVLTSGEGQSEEGRKEEEKGEQRKPEGQGSSREVRAGGTGGRRKEKEKNKDSGEGVLCLSCGLCKALLCDLRIASGEPTREGACISAGRNVVAEPTVSSG